MSNDPVDRRRAHPNNEQMLEAIHARDDTIAALHSAVEALPPQIGQAMQDAILRSVSDPAVWAAAGAALQRHARDQAGGWLLGGLKAIGTKVGWALVIVGGVYLIGGWTALAAMFKAAFAAHN